jgi:hypothetical protein
MKDLETCVNVSKTFNRQIKSYLKHGNILLEIKELRII